GLLHPPDRQDAIAGARARRAPAEQVVTPLQRKVEEALVLAHLPEHQAQHEAVPGVANRVHRLSPSIDERLLLARIVGDYAALAVGALAIGGHGQALRRGRAGAA